MKRLSDINKSTEDQHRSPQSNAKSAAIAASSECVAASESPLNQSKRPRGGATASETNASKFPNNTNLSLMRVPTDMMAAEICQDPDFRFIEDQDIGASTQGREDSLGTTYVAQNARLGARIDETRLLFPYSFEYNPTYFDVHAAQTKYFLGDYDVVRFVQTGTYGVVYEVRRKRDDQIFAAKFFGYTVEKNGKPDERFINKEIEYMYLLKNVKGVVQIEDVYFDAPEGYLQYFNEDEQIIKANKTKHYRNVKYHGIGTCFPIIVMEMLDGGDVVDELQRRLTTQHHFRDPNHPKHERIQKNDLIKMFGEVVLTLDSIHHRGLVHRDIKVENVALKNKSFDIIKLIDYGFMEKITELQSSGTKKSSCGTWIAPEVVRNADYTVKNDIWAAGATLYFLIFFQPLCDIRKIKDLEVVWPERLALFRREATTRFGWPESAGDLLCRMLDLDKDRRISMAEVLKHPLFSNNQLGEANSLYVRHIKRFIICQKMKLVFRNERESAQLRGEEMSDRKISDHFFLQIDTNGDGQISPEEFYDCLVNINTQSSQEMHRENLGELEEYDVLHIYRELFNHVDEDGGGFIEKAEFEKFVSSIMKQSSFNNSMRALSNWTSSSNSSYSSSGGGGHP